jgi:hypothetical protein
MGGSQRSRGKTGAEVARGRAGGSGIKMIAVARDTGHQSSRPLASHGPASSVLIAGDLWSRGRGNARVRLERRGTGAKA